MKKMMNFLRSKKGTVVVAIVALALLATSAVGSTNAALTYYSENYTAQVSMYDIGVTLNENGNAVSYRDYTGSNDVWNESTGKLLENLPEETDGKVVVGHSYQEELSVTNSGNINEYVRIRVYKYWTDPNGNKTNTLAPSLIHLNLLSDSGWIVDEESEERTVLYWPYVLKVNDTTPAISDTLTLDGSLSSKTTTTSRVENGKTIYTTTYNYEGYKFNLEAEVDAVQTHNAEDAIKSAWGVEASNYIKEWEDR